MSIPRLLRGKPGIDPRGQAVTGRSQAGIAGLAPALATPNQKLHDSRRACAGSRGAVLVRFAAIPSGALFRVHGRRAFLARHTTGWRRLFNPLEVLIQRSLFCSFSRGARELICGCRGDVSQAGSSRVAAVSRPRHMSGLSSRSAVWPGCSLTYRLPLLDDISSPASTRSPNQYLRYPSIYPSIHPRKTPPSRARELSGN